MRRSITIRDSCSTIDSLFSCLRLCYKSVIDGDETGFERDWSHDKHAPLSWKIGSIIHYWDIVFIGIMMPASRVITDKKTRNLFFPLHGNDLKFGTRFDLRLPDPETTVRRLETILSKVSRWSINIKFHTSDQISCFHRCIRFTADVLEEIVCDFNLRMKPNPLTVYPFNISAKVIPMNLEYVRVEGGMYIQGADPSIAISQEESPTNQVIIQTFNVSKYPVTQGQFLAFIDDGGYQTSKYWSVEGRRWLRQTRARAPITIKITNGVWYRRLFDKWVILEPNRPITNVCYFEAEAYCEWAGGRLIKESEWEYLATEAGTSVFIPEYEGNLGLERFDTTSVDDDPINSMGVAGMIGNTWCWCQDKLRPYRGFVFDSVDEDSVMERCGVECVVRGGSWCSSRTTLTKYQRKSILPESRKHLTGFRIVEK